MTKLNVVKIGGNVIDDNEKLEAFLGAFAQLSGFKLLVHGGGKVATNLAKHLGIETKMIDGRRITSSEMLSVVVMSYGGLINKKIVSKLQRIGTNGIGLTGADGDLILANKRPVVNGIDYGWVGDPTKVNLNLLCHLFDSGMVPIVAPVTHDGKGNLLNTNADTIASEIAAALSQEYEVALNFCFELSGVMGDVKDPSSLIKNISKKDYTDLKSKGSIKEGMIPKLDNAFHSIDKGVALVRILKYDELANIENGNEYTLIH